MTSDGDDSPTSDEELFRRAVENLDDEQLEQAPFDAPEREHEQVADQLREADVEPVDDDGRQASRSDESDEGDTGGGASERDLFEQAVEGLSAEEIERRKYDDADEAGDEAGGSSGGSPGSAAGSGASRGGSQRDGGRRESTPDREQFEAAMPDVEPIDKSQKHRAPSAPDPEAFFDDGDATRTAADFPTPTLPKQGEGLNDIPSLDEAQKAMLERFERAERRGAIRELNLRGDTAREATDRLREFVESCRREGVEFARIVPGRGRSSDPEPVLKPTVLEWLETSGAGVTRGYAPERIFGGDYGSLVVEFLDD